MSAFAFNPFAEATRRDPFALYARGRAEAPVHVHEGLPVVSIFRHADIQRVLRDPGTFSSDFPLPPGVSRRSDLPNSMLGQDPPAHTRLRSLVNQAFTPRMIRRLVPRMEEIAEDLVGRALAEGRVDLVQALTYPLPVVVIAEIIGVPPEDRARLKGWSDALVANLGLALFGGPSEERLARERRLIDEMRAYFVPLVDERRRTPGEDLLSGLVAAELEGSRLTFDEMLQMVILILVAGNETTTTLIGNAVIELLAHPDQLALVRARPELIPSAVEEVLRYASPVQLDPRRVARPVELGGRALEPDRIVVSWLGSANRDETVFERPDVFDVTRKPGRHLAFGLGPHHCLGATLAATEAEIALRVLLARTESFRRVDDAPLPLHPSPVFRGVTSLPLELVPARRAA
jgi:cytochrome P450